MRKHNIQIKIKMFKFILGSLFGIFLCHSFSGLLSIIGVLLIIAFIKEVESHRINMAIKNIENRATDLEEIIHHLRMENKELRESADALSEKNDELILRLDAVAMNPNPKDVCAISYEDNQRQGVRPGVPCVPRPCRGRHLQLPGPAPALLQLQAPGGGVSRVQGRLPGPA